MAAYRRPKFTADWNLTWTHTFKSNLIDLALYEKLNSYCPYDIDDNNNTPAIMCKEMPARCILNIGGEYTFGPVTLGLNIHNLLGTRYHRSGMNTNVIPQQGRWFLATLGVQF